MSACYLCSEMMEAEAKAEVKILLKLLVLKIALLVSDMQRKSAPHRMWWEVTRLDYAHELSRSIEAEGIAFHLLQLLLKLNVHVSLLWPPR